MPLPLRINFAGLWNERFVIPALQSIVLFSSPLQKEIFKTGETLYDPNIDVTMPLYTIFA